jgi:hypothetical protein
LLALLFAQLLVLQLTLKLLVPQVLLGTVDVLLQLLLALVFALLDLLIELLLPLQRLGESLSRLVCAEGSRDYGEGSGPQGIAQGSTVDHFYQVGFPSAFPTQNVRKTSRSRKKRSGPASFLRARFPTLEPLAWSG